MSNLKNPQKRARWVGVLELHQVPGPPFPVGHGKPEKDPAVKGLNPSGPCLQNGKQFACSRGGGAGGGGGRKVSYNNYNTKEKNELQGNLKEIRGSKKEYLGDEKGLCCLYN